MSEITVGTVVQLNSGGPKMTVANVEGNRVRCHWVDTKGHAQRCTFYLEMLTVCDSSEEGKE